MFLPFMNKTRKSPKAKQWPRIYPQTNRSGQPTYYVDLRKVNGGRPGFPTMEEAETRAELARVQKANEGASAFALPMAIRVDADKANQILAAHGVSILEAAKYYQKHVLAFKDAPPIKDVVARYLKESVDRNLRPRTVGDLKHRLTTFADDFGDSRLSELGLDDLKEWVMDDAWEPRTRINYATKLSQLYNYAVRNKWADTNIAANIDRPTVDETTPKIFSVEQAEKLLSHANEFGLLPFIAVGLFAGVRTAEQMRLTGKSINLDTKTIVIGADAAKKRAQRIIEMEDALVAWLQPCKAALLNGPLYADTMAFRKRKAELLEVAGIEEWPANGLRHSFGTYHLAKFQSTDKTAHQMGNSADVIHRHYKALVTKEEAEKFWSLRPKGN